MMDYQGLTIDFCKSVGANYLLRGVRNNGDFEFEKAIARTNRELSNIETALLTSIQTSFISSSIVREIIRISAIFIKISARLCSDLTNLQIFLSKYLILP